MRLLSLLVPMTPFLRCRRVREAITDLDLEVTSRHGCAIQLACVYVAIEVRLPILICGHVQLFMFLHR